MEQLRLAGADERLIEVVDALTQRHGEPEDDYLARTAAHPLALRIKRVDIEDKLNPANFEGLSNGSIRGLVSRARRRLALLNQLAAAEHT